MDLPVQNNSADLLKHADQAVTSIPEPANVTMSVEQAAIAEQNPSLVFPNVHVNARGLALTVLASIAFILALRFAQRFFIPLIFGVFIAYTLTPLVEILRRIRVPRVIAASLVMIGMLSLIIINVTSLHAEFDAILDQLPVATRKLSNEVSRLNYGENSIVQKMQLAANEIEKATSQAAGDSPALKKPAVSETSVVRLREWLLLGSLSIMDMLGQTVMMLFLVFFLLLSGDTFKRKLVKITGPSLSNKRITVQILSKINTSIQQYMFMLLITNGLLAVLTWIAFRWIGLENAGAWAVTSGLLHVIPYFGSILIAGTTAIIAFMQFGSLSMAFFVAGISIAIASVVGTVVATWMTGRIAKMNPAAVFISLLFWGWLWGVWGLLLGVPIIVILKVISEHVDGMQVFAELLSE